MGCLILGHGPKIDWKMKLSTILFLVLFIQIRANSYSQNTKLTIKLENTRIEQVFNQIESISEFRFLFESDQIDLNQKVSLDVKKKGISHILNLLFKGTDINYRSLNRQIILTKKTAPIIPLNSSINIGGDEIIQRRVTGLVTNNNGTPLPGANVLEKGTSNGTQTDFDGNFSLDVANENAVLSISYIGFATMEVAVNGQTALNISLKENAEGLEEVVLIGYGSVRKKDLTGSVSQIKSEDLVQFPAYNISQSLKARASGVQITQNSGQPGGRIDVKIRGSNSMIGNNDPLYVVDGFPITGAITFLNPADIESIDILKDASATAIYGSRGANGVVIITSKAGKKNQNGKIEIDSYSGVQTVANPYDLLNAKEYAIVANEFSNNNGQVPVFDIDNLPSIDTDWQDVIFRSAFVQDHTVSFSRGNEHTAYNISGNYFDQDGVVINTGIKRGSMRFNLNSDINDYLKFGSNLTISRRERSWQNIDNGYLGRNLLSGALAAPPTLPVFDENGLPTRIDQAYAFGSADMRNPMQFAPRKDLQHSTTIIGSTFLELLIAKGLTLKSSVGVEYSDGFNESFTPIIYDGDRGSAGASMTRESSVLNENILNYTIRSESAHKLDFMAGFSTQKHKLRSFGIGVNGFSNNTTQDFDLSAAETIGIPFSGITEWSLASALGRINYNISDKYLFTFSIRSDGSSRFAKENKWSTFPSGAFAWRVSDEDFMKDSNVFSNLKLRATYGLTGNQGINPYQTLNRLTSVTTVYGNGQDVIGYAPAAIANSGLKWETTAQTDIGFDLGLFQDRINITFDYYKKNTTDLLASVSLPPSIGFGATLQNIGEIENKGIELSIDADILTGGDFTWNTNFQVSGNRNKIIKLSEGDDVYGGGIRPPFSSSLNIAREGEPFGLLYGLVEDGLNDEGLIKYVDQITEDTDNDGVADATDGVINSSDRVIIGNPYPDFIFGFNSNFSYKNLDLNVFIEGVSGNDIFFATAGSHLNSFQRGTNQFTDLIGNYWTENNPDPNARFPKISSGTQYQGSDRFVEDGSYVRIKSMRLSYTIPTDKMDASFLKSAQIFLAATNLATFTKYPGYDPEVNTTGTNSQSVDSRLAIGIDQGAYPSARTFGMGLKLGF